MAEQVIKFLDLPPELSDPATARYAVLPVPFEATAPYKAGTAAGPIAVLEASRHLTCFDEELCRSFAEAGVATCPVVQPAPTVEGQLPRVREAAEPVLRSGSFLLSLGGEHAITVPIVEAAAEMHADLSVLQIDAHPDLRETYEGSRYSHACVMRRVLETTDRICQVGIRSIAPEEYEACPQQVDKFITPAHAAGDPDWIDRALALLSENVYVTLDIDGLDPSIAPGTGCPEPAGLTYEQVVSLLRRVCLERRVVAADIVEVCPIPPNRVTEHVAARLACKIIAYTQL